MTWDVVFSDASKKFLKKLRDAALLDRLLAAAEKLANDPRPPGCRKLAGTSDRYRIRVGDNRSEAEIGRYCDQLIQNCLPRR